MSSTTATSGAAASPEAGLLVPTKRSLRFHLPQSRVGDWCTKGLHMTAFLNALSIFFPPGESFFIRSVQRHKAHPALAGNPELMRAVAGFVGQEAIHSREHEEYNAVLAAAGYPAAPLEGFIDRMLRFLEAVFPISAHLAGESTCTMAAAAARAGREMGWEGDKQSGRGSSSRVGSVPSGRAVCLRMPVPPCLHTCSLPARMCAHVRVHVCRHGGPGAPDRHHGRLPAAR